MVGTIVLDDRLATRDTTVRVQGVSCNAFIPLHDDQVTPGIHRDATRSRKSAKDRHETPSRGYSHGVTRLRCTRASIDGAGGRRRSGSRRRSSARNWRSMLILRENRAVAA